MLSSRKFVYVGFWPRLCAMIVDIILFSYVLFGVVRYSIGPEYIFFATKPEWYFPDGLLLDIVSIIEFIVTSVGVMVFWTVFGATPGKMLIGARVVDAHSGTTPTMAQAAFRYLGYFINFGLLLIPFLKIGIDPKKQGYHDEIAETVVVRFKE